MSNQHDVLVLLHDRSGSGKDSLAAASHVCRLLAGSGSRRDTVIPDGPVRICAILANLLGGQPFERTVIPFQQVLVNLDSGQACQVCGLHRTLQWATEYQGRC